MRVLLTGADGQVGRELQITKPDHTALIRCGHTRLDIADEIAVQQMVHESRPGMIINAAAYTNVDQAEEAPDLAFEVNAEGPAHLARAAQTVGAAFIHLSTDFVFDGRKSFPYEPLDEHNPLGVYGRSKSIGEQKVLQELGPKALIVRTAWVYQARGQNFVNTMLRLMQNKESLGVVADQVGTPTWARSLANMLWDMIAHGATGVYHWSDAGVATWYDFALGIQEEALRLGYLDRKVQVEPMTTKDFPTKAARPAYSVLDKTSSWDKLGYKGRHWRQNLRQMLKEKKGL